MQDRPVIEFLRRRQDLMNVDMNNIVSTLDQLQLKQPADQVILVMSIVLLKTANNLVLELGDGPFTLFF